MPLYQPIVLAKQLATLDVLSGGRLDVGLGLGWSSDEWAAAGVSMERRGARADEFLKVLEAVWTEDPVEFTGEFYRVPRATWRHGRCSARTRPCSSGAITRACCVAPPRSATATRAAGELTATVARVREVGRGGRP